MSILPAALLSAAQPFDFARGRLPRGLALLGAITSFARSLLTRHPLGALSSGLGYGWFAGVVFEPGDGKQGIGFPKKGEPNGQGTQVR
jgi:hypothetical protein